MGTSVILITHDLGLIAESADRVAIMYAGQIIEQADIGTVFETPMHPYTKGLIASVPILGQVQEELEVIPGAVPNLVNMPPGCRFAPRCRAREEHNLEICNHSEPDLTQYTDGHTVRCWLYQDGENHAAPLKVEK